MLRAVRLHGFILELLRWVGLFRFKQSCCGYIYWTWNDHFESAGSNTSDLDLNDVISPDVHIFNSATGHVLVVINLNFISHDILNLFYSRIWDWSNSDDRLHLRSSCNSNQAKGFSKALTGPFVACAHRFGHARNSH